jgi:glutaredoxin/glutathione-dependent peroxiredoxin
MLPAVAQQCYEPAMTIEAGQKIPSVSVKIVTADGTKDANTAELFAGQKVVMFSLPGAFTPTCSAKHLPGYVAKAAELKAKGVTMIACLSVNDAFVMDAWAKEHNALGVVTMIADGSSAFTKALGIEGDLSAFCMGHRARRGLFVIENGTVTTVELEAAGKFEVSSAEACSVTLGK